MPKPTEYDKTHLRNMAAIGTRIDRIFKKAAEEAARIGESIKAPLPEDRIFSFDDFPETQKQIERLMAALQESMEVTVVNGVRSAWTLSNNKNNALVSRIFGDRAGDLSKERYRRYFSTNGAALDAFLQRRQQGLDLSDRVWKYTNMFKREIELGLDLGIRSGESAQQMGKSLRQYLRHPDKLFRRVRDKHGVLRLSKAAQEFHPGRGVYRSSYKNARRLACTETNIAYRTSDHLRWQQMDFVVGIEIKLSNNHTLNGVPLTDICDTLAGRYPKDFKFTGWHPHCRCHVVTVLKTDEEMAEDTRRILDGEQPKKSSVNAVRDVPAAFRDWVEEHSDRIEMGGNLPYFVKDNPGAVQTILRMSDNPAFATIVNVGDKEYLLKDLIAECRIEATENGRIYVHPDHGKGELMENLDFAKWRAERFGEEVILLPNPQGVKSADSYNITRGVQEEYKRGLKPTKNSVSQLIRDGKDQADYLIVEMHPAMNVSTTLDAITSRITDNANPPRCPNIKEIRLRVGDYEAVYTRQQIVTKGFKIKPEDFHSVSAPRSQGSSLTSNEAGSISDAKLAKFFGLNKKTPQEAAIERHAKRDAAQIQQAWNDRRIARIRQAAADGLLPKESVEGLAGLPQVEFNARIEFLQKRAAQHASRTPAEIDRIKEAWEKNKQRKANIRIMADNVLCLRTEYPYDVDFSALEKVIADGNLTKMEQEAKKVGQAIRAIRDEEKALADLIPDARGWHKMFDLSELKEAHAKIQATLDYWKAKGYDLATDSNLSILKTELEQKIKFVENPGAFKAGLTAHKTWQVQRDSYIKLLDKVETRIETVKLEADYNTLLGFKTTSKDFKDFMAKAKAAIDAGDVKTAKSYIASAQWKQKVLEHNRKGKSGTSVKSTSSQIGDDAYSQKRKDAAMWAQDTEEADKRLRGKCGEVWRGASSQERGAIYGYTQSYCNINEPLRGLTYCGSATKKAEGLRRIPHIESIIDRSSYDFDMWLQRGDGMVALKKFGLTNWSNPTDADIMALLGAEGVEGAFWSAGVAKGKGFSGDIIFNIYAPKGTKAMYCEPFSAYGHGSGKNWDGIAGQSSYGHESEILIQRGTKFKIIKIEKSGGTWYIDVDIIEQHPVTFPYVGGYPFK